MIASAPSSPLRRNDFLNIEQFSAAFTGWGMQFLQLSPGRFKGRAMVLEGKGLSIYFLSVNRKVHAMGAKPNRRLSFSHFVSTQGPLPIAHGTQIAPTCIYGFDAQREVDVVTPQSSRLVVVDMEQTLFQYFANQAGRYDLDDTFLSQNSLFVDPEHFAYYAHYLNQVFYLCRHHPQTLATAEMQSLIQRDLGPLLINTLRRRTQTQTPQPLRRAKIVKMTQNFMLENMHRPITLADLTEEMHVSRRSLIYGFKDIFGMGPMAYLKLQRLNGVRCALLKGNPEYETVKNISHLWGFHSPGHFSQDYQALFGETPAETLRKNQ